MTRGQALIISILFGLVLLVFTGLAALFILSPVDGLFASTPSPTIPPPSPAATLTPTLPNFLPTPGSVSPVPVAPTPTNTRLPTFTPHPTTTLAPTIAFVLTLPVRSTATPTPTIVLPPTVGSRPSTPEATVSPPPVRFDIVFDADEARIDEGDCTDLRWRVEGARAVRLDGQPTAPRDTKKVCPDQATFYRLTVYLPDGNEVSREVEVTVRESSNNDNGNNDNNDDTSDDDDDN